MITTLHGGPGSATSRSTGEGEPWIILRGPASASSRIVSYPSGGGHRIAYRSGSALSAEMRHAMDRVHGACQRNV